MFAGEEARNLHRVSEGVAAWMRNVLAEEPHPTNKRVSGAWPWVTVVFVRRFFLEHTPGRYEVSMIDTRSPILGFPGGDVGKAWR